MNHSSFVRKFISLALALALIITQMPECRASAAPVTEPVKKSETKKPNPLPLVAVPVVAGTGVFMFWWLKRRKRIAVVVYASRNGELVEIGTFYVSEKEFAEIVTKGVQAVKATVTVENDAFTTTDCITLEAIYQDGNIIPVNALEVKLKIIDFYNSKN